MTELNTNTGNDAAAMEQQTAADQGQQEGQGQEQQQETSLGGNAEEEQTQEGQQTEEKKKEEDGKQENEFFGKPEAYDYKDVKLPENMQLDANMTGKFNEYAAKLNLSQKGANDLMAMAVELTQKTQQQTVEAMGKLQEAKIEGYRQLLNSDKEVGGANLKESIATANVAYDAFFPDEELRTMLAEGGLNVHPKFIKALKAIGSQMKNDTIHSSGNPAAEKKAREDILYPSMQDNE